MVSQKYRWDFIGLSTDTKPTSETSDKVVNGSTFYCSDTSKLYVYCDGTWYERKPLGGGGTSDFNDLSNRPKYNGSDMTGSTNIPEVKTYTAGSNVSISDQNVISATDTTYSAFTGTDGTAGGQNGLVPAPVATDAGKFLNANGTWEEVQGGGVTELTSADYNYPTNNPTSVALWLLEPGVYTWDNGVNVQLNTDNRAKKGISIVSSPENDKVSILNIPAKDEVMWFSTVSQSNGQQMRQFSIEGAVNYLTDTSGTAPLAANQGRVLKSQIGDLASLTTTDKTNLVAAINEAATGGGGVIELTSADYNWPTNNPNGVALWLLEPGTYHAAAGVGYYTAGVGGSVFTDGASFIVNDLQSSSTGIVQIKANTMYYGVIDKATGAIITANTRLTTPVVQTTGTSTTDVMSQNAVTSMVFANPSTKTQVRIANTSGVGTNSISIGASAGGSANADYTVSLGASSQTIYNGTVALGAYSGGRTVLTGNGIVAINSTNTSYGYNSSNYRLLTGLYDPQSAHDAATKGYVDPTTDSSAPTTATVGRLGQIQIDTTNNDAYMCVAVDNTTPAYTWKKITV